MNVEDNVFAMRDHGAWVSPTWRESDVDIFLPLWRNPCHGLCFTLPVEMPIDFEAINSL